MLKLKLICPKCKKLADSFVIDYKEIRYCSVLYSGGQIDWDTDETTSDPEVNEAYIRCTNCYEIISDRFETIDGAFARQFEILLDENNNIKDIGDNAKKVLYELARENNINITNDEELNNFFKMYYNL